MPITGDRLLDIERDGKIKLINSPGDGERFLPGEIIHLEARVSSGTRTPPHYTELRNRVTWWLNGQVKLGEGLKCDWVIPVFFRNPNGETIQLKYQNTLLDQVTVRLFGDLGEFYKAQPAACEIARIKRDFTINWQDGPTLSDLWSKYENTPFDQSSPEPSKLAFYAKLDVLRHQVFSQPLPPPFDPGKSIYEHVKSYVRRLSLRLDNGINVSGGGNSVSLNRSFSSWTPAFAYNTPQDPLYILSLQLLIHECRHCQPNDPLHSDCSGNFGGFLQYDANMEIKGSGFAQAAIYLMWVYEYGIYEPGGQTGSDLVKHWARTSAHDLLHYNFCSPPPTHTIKKIQDVITKIY